MGSVLTVVMTPLVRMELENEREGITDPVVNRRGAGMDLSGRCPIVTGSQIRNILCLIEGEPATQVARGLGMSRAAALCCRIRELAVPAV